MDVVGFPPDLTKDLYIAKLEMKVALYEEFYNLVIATTCEDDLGKQEPIVNAVEKKIAEIEALKNEDS